MMRVPTEPRSFPTNDASLTGPVNAVFLKPASPLPLLDIFCSTQGDSIPAAMDEIAKAFTLSS
jgi:hypothetical protein